MTQQEIDSIADSLAAAKHEPEHPSYSAFVADTLAQFEALKAQGYSFGFVSGTESYSSSEAMFSDLDNNRRMVVSTDGAPFADKHPLDAFIYLPENRRLVRINDIFRAVHDFNGHYLTRAPFETFDGELTAYRNHLKMYSDIAKSALFGETVAQLCWFYSRNEFVPVQICAIIPGAPINL